MAYRRLAGSLRTLRCSPRGSPAGAVLAGSAAGAAAIWAASSSGGTSSAKAEEGSAGKWAWDAGCSGPSKPIHELSVSELQAAMTAGHLTASSCVAHFTDRIATMNDSLNAVNEINPDAEAIAAELDAERKAGKVRGPMHGICVLLKENIDTGDSMLTTAGSLALMSSSAAGDATIAAKLREAGAVLLGKTVSTLHTHCSGPRRSQSLGLVLTTMFPCMSTEPLRVGEFPVHVLPLRLVSTRWPVPQPSRPRSFPLRILRWLRLRHRRIPLHRRRRDGD